MGHVTQEREISVQGDAGGVFPPTLEPARLDPPTHPALPRLRTGPLRLARRARRTDWAERIFEACWMALLLGCAAECVSRLLWAVQP